MKRVLLLILSLLLLLGCTYDPTESEDADKLEIFAFSIGKADAILIRHRDASILIDTGENGDGTKLLEKLANIGVTKLDLLILTHFDKDHIGGADKIIQSLPIDRIVMPAYEKDETKQFTELNDALIGTSAEIVWLSEDESREFGALTVQLWVSPVPYDGKSDNNQSIVTKVVHNGKAYLFMGDAEEAELKALIFSGKNLTCEVIKMPHHGVYDAQLPALLAVTMPSYAIICDSEKNPADNTTLETLSYFDTTVLETKDGDVHLIAAENVIKIAE